VLPDYVFEPDYKLMEIEELEQFIAREKHLPNVPKAREFKEKGIDLSRFQMKLLEKAEELTLYIVQQQRTIAALKSQNSTLDARVAALEQMIEHVRKEQAESGEKK
jgi:hypothetical protein